MLEHVVDALVCPHGEPELALVDGGLLCPAGHRFDIARQGYVNLLAGPAPAAADTAAMVAARERFQAAGHHDALTDALVRAVTGTRNSTEATVRAAMPTVSEEASGLIVDLGAGTGRHLAAVVERAAAPAGLALDVSKHAARRAARAHPRIGAVVCDVWRPLPVRSGAAAVVLEVFAPRSVPEIARILAPRGLLVVATPTPRHLAPLVDRLGLLRVGEDKLERLDAELAEVVDLVDRDVVETVSPLDHLAVEAMVAMGPSAHHLGGERLTERLAELPDPVEVACSVTVSTYRRRGA